MRVLVIEDDDDVAEPLVALLEREGYEVERAGDGEHGLRAALERSFDVVLLDVNLPGRSGLDVCRALRAEGSTVRVLMLTARSNELDAVVGLDAGADDYLAKPVRPAELLARIRALLRREVALAGAGAPPTDTAPLRRARVRVDEQARRAWLDDNELELTNKEFDLLALFVRNEGHALTRERIMESVWDEHWYGSTKTLDMHVSTLRRKLGDDPLEPHFIATLRGVGFRFEPR